MRRVIRLLGRQDGEVEVEREGRLVVVRAVVGGVKVSFGFSREDAAGIAALLSEAAGEIGEEAGDGR